MTSPLPPRQTTSEPDVVDLRDLAMAEEWPEQPDLERPELAAVLAWLEQPEEAEQV